MSIEKKGTYIFNCPKEWHDNGCPTSASFTIEAGLSPEALEARIRYFDAVAEKVWPGILQYSEFSIDPVPS